MAYSFAFNPISGNLDLVTAADTKQILVSSADLVEGYIYDKLSLGSALTKAILNPGANELLSLDIDQSAIDHGSLDATSLTHDDHAQYALLAGRTGGQVLCGGDTATNWLTLKANSATPLPAGNYIDTYSTIIPHLDIATLTNQGIKYDAKFGGIWGNSLAINITNAGPTGSPFVQITGGTTILMIVYNDTLRSTVVTMCNSDPGISAVFNVSLVSNGFLIGTGGAVSLSGGTDAPSLGISRTNQWANIFTNGITSDGVGSGGLNIVAVSGPIYYSSAVGSVITDATVDWTATSVNGNASITTWTGNIDIDANADLGFSSVTGDIIFDAFKDVDINAGGSFYIDAPTGGISVAGATGIGFTSSAGTISFDAFTEVTLESLQSQIFISGLEYAFSTVGTVPITLYTGVYDIGGQPPKLSIYTGAGQSLDTTIYLPPAQPTASGQPIISDTTGNWTYFAPAAINLVPFFGPSAAFSTDANFTYNGSTLGVLDVDIDGLSGNIISSTSVETSIEELDESIYMLQSTGFCAWTSGSAASTWSITGNKFKVIRAGYGHISGKKVSWLANQETSALTANACTYVYMDSTGTIGSTTTRTDALFHNDILLFEVLYDGTNYQVVRENHEYSENTELSLYLHYNAGTVIRSTGAVITRVATGTGGAAGDRQLKIVGQDVLEDHGVETTIPDSAGAAITWDIFYKNATGKWIRYSAPTQFPMEYNNAGTPTALGTGPNTDTGVYRLYVSKDNINSSSPTYVAVMNNAVYNTVAQATSAINAGTVAIADNELSELELAQLGYIVVENNGTGGYINTVIVAKSTFNKTYLGGATASSHLLLSDLNTLDSGHLQFVILNGRTTPQTICGGELTTESLTLRGNAANTTTGAVLITTDVEAVGSTAVASLKTSGGLYVTKKIITPSLVEFYTNSQTTSITGSGSASSSAAYTLPVAAPTANGQVLSCTTAGVMSWAYGSKKVITTKTAIATLSDAEFMNGVILLDGTSAVVPITLPTPSSANSGYPCILKCINAANACTISNTVDGVSGYAFSGTYDFVTVINDGSNYYFV